MQFSESPSSKKIQTAKKFKQKKELDGEILAL